MILNSIYHTLDKLLSQAKQSLQTPGMWHVLNLTSGTPETKQETEFAFQKLGQEAEFLVDQKKGVGSRNQRGINTRDMASIFGFLLGFLCHLLSLCGFCPLLSNG